MAVMDQSWAGLIVENRFAFQRPDDGATAVARI